MHWFQLENDMRECILKETYAEKKLFINHELEDHRENVENR